MILAAASFLPVGKLKLIKKAGDKVADVVGGTRAAQVTSCVVSQSSRSSSSLRMSSGGGLVCRVLDADFSHAWDQHSFGGSYHQAGKTQNVFDSGITKGKLRELIDDAIANGKAIPRARDDDRSGYYIEHFWDGVDVGLNGQNGVRIVVDGSGNFVTAMPKFFF